MRALGRRARRNMSDCIEGVQEAVDGEFGAALTARSAELSRGPVALGPPDLCYLHKSYRSALGLGGLKLLGGTVQLAQDQAAVGFYHHVIGLDTSSPATVSAYFAELAASQQSASWLAGGTWTISGGVYCCYDAFTRQDLRVHVTIPGGVSATLLRCDGGVVRCKRPSRPRLPAFPQAPLVAPVLGCGGARAHATVCFCVCAARRSPPPHGTTPR